VREVKTEKDGDYHTLIRVSVKTEAGERSVAGTLFSNAEPRLVELFGIKVEAELTGDMMYIVNEDAPASSAASAPCWARTTSTSAPSTWAAAMPVARRCCCSRSTARWAKRFWPRREPARREASRVWRSEFDASLS
jgi:hypothetical protein